MDGVGICRRCREPASCRTSHASACSSGPSGHCGDPVPLWYLHQLIEGSFGLFNAHANGGGVAFFAHVGGFVFGVLVTPLLVRAGQATPQARYAGSPLP